MTFKEYYHKLPIRFKVEVKASNREYFVNKLTITKDLLEMFNPMHVGAITSEQGILIIILY